MQKNIVIDFDGTLMPYSFPEAKEPYPETKEALNRLRDMGFKIIISSARTSDNLFYPSIKDSNIDTYYNTVDYIRNYLNKYNIPFDTIHEGKPIAKYYIDDRAIRIINGNWGEILNTIKGEENAID